MIVGVLFYAPKAMPQPTLLEKLNTYKGLYRG